LTYIPFNSCLALLSLSSITELERFTADLEWVDESLKNKGNSITRRGNPLRMADI
jgi:hypothetical protein